MLQIDRTLKIPYYVQIYRYYRREVEAQRMIAGMKLPSVRELAQTVNVSKDDRGKGLLSAGERRLYLAQE